MYKIKVSNTYSFELTNQGGYSLNGQPLEIDERKKDANSAHVLFNNRSYTTEIVSFDAVTKTAKVKVNGRLYDVQVQDQFDLLLKELGMENLAAGKVKDVKAPMPGLVLNVMVGPGSEVRKGDNLLVLEAMKMENILKSPADGRVRSVLVNVGDKVDKNTLLLVFES
ncbi:acetyl-CoA carboxylase biotin carboxyl carrier protein subunit [Pedobacter yulinensis]|uniref:Acetyl-CoA carboxylase biotin carboxyl carrier protein subunit n=1 Tax=Pedobacter yulinensis TaxID=2126353 RepID=A0A2T3HQR2_9SPHI|nr:biotin/lipoyl-containing protein [Pedobacter yulinensis]PST84795.1 acetyl-CoA carboxylase biotin carboxyl carrier protein subunit [Pedobacter yulinensis]